VSSQDNSFGELGYQHLYEEQLEKASLYKALEKLQNEYESTSLYLDYQTRLIDRHNKKISNSIIAKFLRLFSKNFSIGYQSKSEFLGLNKVNPFLATIRSDYGVSRYLDLSFPKETFIKLEKTPVYLDFSVLNLKKFKASMKARVTDENNIDKLALVRVSFFDEKGNEIDANKTNLWYSKTVGFYKYLAYESGSFNVELDIPSEAYYLRLGVQKWAAREDVYVKNSLEVNLPKPDDNVVLGEDLSVDRSRYQDGISIITASYKGLDTICDMIESVLAQNIDRKLIQLIVVVNGYDDGTIKYLNEIKQQNPILDMVIKFSEKAGASHARNLAIEISDREFCVILDDDDIMQPDYLKSMYEQAAPGRLVVSGIYDFIEKGDFIKDNAICQQVVKAADNNDPSYLDVNGVITMSACKLVPTKDMKTIAFKENLKSGEDVVFFSNLISKFDFDVKVVKPNDDNVYLRRLKANSVSRRDDSFEFLVTERLLVIKELMTIINSSDRSKAYIIGKINAQSNFIKGYLNRHSDEYKRVIEAVKFSGAGEYVFPIINKSKAKGIVYSYCFPPYVDTAGVVAAKRIQQKGDVVDVVCNKMNSIRDKSAELSLICGDLIESSVELATPTSFGDWKAIEKFALDGYSKVGSKKDYEYVYSRALWPASHFAGFVHKINNPKSTWIAEFSDPSLWDINAEMRVGKVVDGPLKELIKKHLAKKKIKLSNKDWNMYLLCELLPYIFADELIFTCENQKKVMLDKFPLKRVTESIDKKSTVSAHPTLPKKYYNYVEPRYKANSSLINIGYFGAFYENRGLDGFLKALAAFLNNQDFHIHVFTSQLDELAEVVSELKLNDRISINPYLGYMEFLAVLDSFDCLLVNDTNSKGIFNINPYLPSKLSDYIGSSADILALCEEGSELSKVDSIQYKAFNFDDIGTSLEKMAAKKAKC
jgi:hypothetical protein